MDVFITKRKNIHESERFEPVKLHQSITAACLAVRAYEGEAHMTAQKVCEKVIEWLETKTEVTSQDVRRIATTHLSLYKPEAAYLYQNYGAMV